ncbi:unnamed protein product [Mesocestoides corti]|uniref:Zinc finger protein n=1 Tax=Mesocestoides corti TaxID=53468 RepID=A0A0R3U1L3_MESCO|nr:unnamed protein product [Mesocestoides corti]
MSQGLHGVLAGNFNCSSLPFSFVDTNEFKRPGNFPTSAPDNITSTFSPSTPSTSTGCIQFPFIEKPSEGQTNGDSSTVKEKLLAALKEIIPHKTSLNLRMLVTYTVDNATSDVIVIDETVNRKEPELPSRAPAGNILDLSQKSEDPAKAPVLAIDSNLVSMLQKPTAPIFNVVSNTGTPVSLAQPTNTPPPPPPLNPEAALMMLQTILNGGGQGQFGSLSFPVPTSFATSQHLPGDIVPNVTIMTNENILPTFPFGAKVETMVNQKTESGSGSSSPLSNHEGSSTPLAFRAHQRNSSSGGSGGFSRRYMHPRRFICNQCRQQFSSLAELNRHTLELHNSFRCNFCKAKFTQRSNLQRHSLKHVGFKPFTCNICLKEYYRKDHLVRHIEVTHPNVDPRINITTRLTSSECLDFLDNLHVYGGADSPFVEAGVDVKPMLIDGSKPLSVKVEETSRQEESSSDSGTVGLVVDKAGVEQNSEVDPGTDQEMHEPVKQDPPISPIEKTAQLQDSDT